MPERMIDRMARLALEVERATTPDTMAVAVAAFRRAASYEPVAFAGAVLELYRATGRNRVDRVAMARQEGPLAAGKMVAAADLFDAKVRKAMRSTGGDLQRAAELLWTWGRQDRGFGDAMIRLFLVSWP